MGAIWLHETPAFLRKHGIRFETYPGWETRSRSTGGLSSVLAIGLHHTASAAAPANQMAWMWRNSPDRPVGNFFIDRDGLVTLGAAGAANTQGRGGPITTSKGTIPKDRGNVHMIAIEAANNGIGQEWTAPQMDAYVKLCVALCDQFGLDPRRDILSHWEYVRPSQPNRKIDPAGPTPSMPEVGGTAGRNRWNDAAFRERVAKAMGGGSTSPSPPPTTSYSTYVVRPGDSWWRIAQTVLGSGSRWQELANLNNSVALRPGVGIRIPSQGGKPPAPTVAPPPPPFNPQQGQFGTWPNNASKPNVKRGSSGDAVRYLQGVLRSKAGMSIAVDGQFGPQTENRVKTFQRSNNLTASGVVGKAVWNAIDTLAKR